MDNDTMEDISLESESAVEIKEIIRESFLDDDFDTKYMPVKIQLIRNPNLLSQYEEKKQELLIRGRTSDELEDKYGFLVETNHTSLESLCYLGLCTHDSDYNTLGYNCMGVYLSRHADVCLRHALVKYSGQPSIHVIVCKFIMGHNTTAIPRVASSADFIEPTQGFDCHISVIPPSTSDSLQNQFDRSQIYIYDINTLLQPAARPRQILPYAVVTYTVNGQHHVAADVESVAESISDAVPNQLQQIIQQINAKAGGNYACPQSFPNTLTVSSADFQQKPNVRAMPSLQDGGARSTCVSKSASVSKASEQPESADDHLQRVISQINARLESQERSNRLTWSELAVQRAGAGSAGASVSCTTIISSANVLCSTSVGNALSRLASSEPNYQLSSGVANLRPAHMAGAAYGMQDMSVVNHSYLAGVGHTQGSMAALAAAGSGLGVSGYLGMSPVTMNAPRQVPVAMTPELVGAHSLTGMFATAQQLTSTPSFMPASAYYRTMPGIIDTSGMAGLDPNAAAMLSRVKYVPYGASAASSSEIAGLAGGFYQVPTVTLADAVAAGSGYTLVNTAGTGAAVKRPLNDIMLYMYDKKPRFY